MLDNKGASRAQPFGLSPEAIGWPSVSPETSRLTSCDFAQIYRDEQPRLFRYVRAHVRDPDDVLDLVQEAFFRLLRSAAELDVHAPAAYLRRTARNLVVDLWRRERARPVHFPLNDGDYELQSPPQQSWEIEGDQLERCYRTALAALAPRTREIFLLHRVGRKPHREIAERFGITVAGVEYHMARALARIAWQLEQ